MFTRNHFNEKKCLAAIVVNTKKKHSPNAQLGMWPSDQTFCSYCRVQLPDRKTVKKF